jgi:hypothetical protein
VIVQLAFIFTLPVHFGHLLQRVKHGLDDHIVCTVDICADLKLVRTDELTLNSADVNWEVFDEMGYSLALLAGQFGLFDTSNLLSLASDVEIRI